MNANESDGLASSDLGDRLRHFRERAGLTREQVAGLAERGFHTVASWEQGKRAPRVHQLQGLARLYGVSMGELIGETPGLVADGSPVETRET